ncbi:uncharacterized protein LOC130680904 isoform X1 [Manis pentadactyla]|uniref:uncharacterized protein LOC130680904 isoform X1 n=1 Tax=Manis pentadactyla TaxID=143292 RepID=UPI00255C3931|nr:uncharacterized protein LOC130680904 isoform X1 [Manis pentadactyla]
MNVLSREAGARCLRAPGLGGDGARERPGRSGGDRSGTSAEAGGLRESRRPERTGEPGKEQAAEPGRLRGQRDLRVESVQGLPRKAGSEEMVEELTGWPKEVTVRLASKKDSCSLRPKSGKRGGGRQRRSREWLFLR